MWLNVFIGVARMQICLTDIVYNWDDMKEFPG